MAGAGRKLKDLYHRFERAAAMQDAKTVRKIVLNFPEFHDFEGGGGGLVNVLNRDAPGLLEVALKAGLHPDAGQSEEHQTVLQKAASEGDLEKLRLLLKYGADPEKRNDWDETALGYACAWGQLEAVKILLDAGAEINAVEAHPESGYRNTALESARQHPEVVAYMRSRGAKTLDELDG